MASTPGKPPAGVGPEQNPLLHDTERGNEALVRSFCAAWSAMDPDAIVSHLAQDCIYQIYEGGPVKRGVPEIHATLSAFVGCTTNSSAASAAGHVAPTQRRSTTNDSAPAHACSSRFVRWNITGDPPPSCQSIP